MLAENKLRVIGLMSGTSLDGLDICFVEFGKYQERYVFNLLATETVSYSTNWENRLKGAMQLTEAELSQLDIEYGILLANCVNEFIKRFELQGKVELIASHGHTVYHQPQKGITLQIGSGKEVQRITGINVINDFRILDVKLGGQGAPLVPVGDHYLFSEYDACLNLGGFSNISYVEAGERIAFDISPCNLPINFLTKKFFDRAFDQNGELAGRGNPIPDLINKLNALPYYLTPRPKSLGAEWLNTAFMPIVEEFLEFPPEDLIHSVTSHVGLMIGGTIEGSGLKRVLTTGGGAYNRFLTDKIRERSKAEIIVPSGEIIEFKEALIFAFLGYLNVNNSINTFKSVTGARENSMGGIRHFSH